MHAGKRFTTFQALMWTRNDILVFLIIGTLPVILYDLLDLKWLSIPWLPIALVGTAVAFITGFKNNASYDRLWEGRKIWGAIVNTSRSWGMMVLDYVNNDHALQKLSEAELKTIHQRLIYRHIAWMTALRFQLRAPRVWENMTHDKSNIEFRDKYFDVVETKHKLEDDIHSFLSEEEKKYILSKKNRATHLIRLQSKDLKELKQQGYIEDFRHMDLENKLVDFYTHQGQGERIKNFPYPRQYTTINSIFIWIFILLLPFGMMYEFEKIGDHFVWLTIPFTVISAWVFHTMDKIGTSSESPFEGGANDIPITALSRTIEIDLREMLDETDLPEPVQPVNDILS
ncbi:MAG: hypothetical protein DHS20C18_51490 [Saprospiraceae bacterium]|nr:MAG: hypothetical protein DHS20C18_51490 [Saprospiraceae bacterium]